MASSASSSVMSLLREFPNLIHLHGKSPERPESFEFAGLENGIPKGAVIEISGSPGSGKTEVALRLLAQNPKERVAWVEDEFTVYPSAFPQSRVGLDRVLFVDAPAGEALWSAQQLLRSGVFGILVLRACAASSLDEMALRRLQLAAEKAQATVVLLSDEPARRGTWPISVQLQARRSIEDRSIHLHVLKYQGRKSWRLSLV